MVKHMKYFILYNPLSNRGKSSKALKLVEKKIKDHEYEIKSLLEIDSVSSFLDKLTKDDRVIIIGGDGTLHHLANAVDFEKVEHPIEFYTAGTGNDFARSVKGKKKLVVLNNYLKKLPTVEYNGKTEVVINGTGIGLDGYVCNLVNNSTGKKNKLNYFKNAFKSFVKYKPHDVEYIINNDEQTRTKVKKAWFVSAMHSSYFGGGMKIAPKAKRESNKLQLVVISKVPKWLLILIFPTIYLGWHVIFKSFVKVIEVDSVEIISTVPTYAQIDGEDRVEVSRMYIKR